MIFVDSLKPKAFHSYLLIDILKKYKAIICWVVIYIIYVRRGCPKISSCACDQLYMKKIGRNNAQECITAVTADQDHIFHVGLMPLKGHL